MANKRSWSAAEVQLTSPSSDIRHTQRKPVCTAMAATALHVSMSTAGCRRTACESSQLVRRGTPSAHPLVALPLLEAKGGHGSPGMTGQGLHMRQHIILCRPGLSLPPRIVGTHLCTCRLLHDHSSVLTAFESFAHIYAWADILASQHVMISGVEVTAE